MPRPHRGPPTPREGLSAYNHYFHRLGSRISPESTCSSHVPDLDLRALSHPRLTRFAVVRPTATRYMSSARVPDFRRRSPRLLPGGAALALRVEC
jgi:hypothetical protein